MAKLNETSVKALAAPATGNRITYDDAIKGFGCRVTAEATKSFILNYRAGGRERRLTIGSYPDWTVSGARDEAKRLKKLVDVGDDPMRRRHDERDAPTINELCNEYEMDELGKRRPSTVVGYRSLIKVYIRPRLGQIRVADLERADAKNFHRLIARDAPVRANRALAMLSLLLSYAIELGYRADNPTKGIKKGDEPRRQRFLNPAEIAALAGALAKHPEKTSADALRLLMLTGARKGETLTATWDQFDLEAGVWTKPRSHTKQKREHRVPLSAPALALLSELKKTAAGEFVFPGVDDKKPLLDVKRTWATVCKQAGIKGVRIHDLRHTYASILASAGMSLPIIGALLGHSNPATTARYSHLFDDPLRQATERVGAVISGRANPTAVVKLRAAK